MFPIQYDEPVFRPPSEGNSLILQITIGCSYNECSFCEMYTSKQFKPRQQTDIFKDIEAFYPYADQIQKVFLADGDPMVLSNKRLVPILQKLKLQFPNLRRVSAYATPANLNKKTLEELLELKMNGLSLVYVGIESGDNAVLQLIKKGESYDSIVSGLNKSKQAGMDASVMVIKGVGGRKNSREHAIESAKVLNATQPKFASTLVLMTHKGMEHYTNRLDGSFEPMEESEQFQELKTFVEHLQLEHTIFRSDHASNRLVLKGTLGKDKTKFIRQIEEAIQHPNKNNLRPDAYRGY